MISRFYRAGSRRLLLTVLLTFPVLYWLAHAESSNNDIETWLPRETPVRQTYEQFKRDFGVEEVVLVGYDRAMTDPALIEAVAERMEALPGVRDCITPQRLVRRMQDLGVPEAEARRRLSGLLIGDHGTLEAMIVGLNEYGAAHRLDTVAALRDVLAYCQMERPQLCLAGSPVLVSELDRLGSPEASQAFFGLTLLVCLSLLQYSLGDWRMSLALLGVTVWTIVLTKSIVLACGGEMNFIMGALSVMVMIFTLSIAVHYLSYYSDARAAGDPDPVWAALKESWKPCVLPTITTLLGLLSLNVSSILPVRQFGYSAALGAVIAMFVGLGVTPALVSLWPDYTVRQRTWFNFHRWGGWVGRRRWQLLTGGALVMLVVGWGLTYLKPDINPAEFLPKSNPVALDLRRVQRELTSVGSIEAIVDFGLTERPFVDRLLEVRRIEEAIRAHPGVRHTLSIATFFPKELPDSPLACAQLFSRAMKDQGDNGYLAQDQRLWRISVRVAENAKPNEVCRGLEQLLAGEPVYWTGVSPLIGDAQHEIFQGYWQSFTTALVLISLVLILALRSVTRGLVAMVPNVLPVWLVFGAVGYIGLPIDIGMMMTGSIALGISVDCTFHFLVKYQEAFKRGASSIESCQAALEHTGKPLMESTVISSLGMLALCLSSFTPTSRFGWLMAAQMTASLLGELVLLPALLSLRRSRVRVVGAELDLAERPGKAAAGAGARLDPPHGKVRPAILEENAPAAVQPLSGKRRRRGLEL